MKMSKFYYKFKQASAAAEEDDDFKIFSQERPRSESNRNSAKNPNYYRFSVRKPEDFWRYYWKLLISKNRSETVYQETIREDKPCRFYLDLEFMIAANPDIDGEKLTFYFIDHVCVEIENVYDLIVDRKKDVLQLDSSTDDKFSRHVIIHLPENKYFENNIALGRFVTYCVDQLKSFKQNDKQELMDKHLEHFFVKTNNCDDVPVSFCDLAVYSRNRNFRIYLSNKLSKDNPFKLAENCMFYAAEAITTEEQHKQVLFDTLIECLSPIEPDNLLHFDEQNNTAGLLPERSLIKRERKAIIRKERKECPVGDDFCPNLDDEILGFVRRYHSDVVITKRDYKECYNTVLFCFDDYHYCPKLKRHHNSNHSFVIVQINTKKFYQKCRDADCRDYEPEMYDLAANEKIYAELRKFQQRFSSIEQNSIDEEYLNRTLPDDLAAQVAVEPEELAEILGNMSI